MSVWFCTELTRLTFSCIIVAALSIAALLRSSTPDRRLKPKQSAERWLQKCTGRTAGIVPIVLFLVRANRNFGRPRHLRSLRPPCARRSTSAEQEHWPSSHFPLCSSWRGRLALQTLYDNVYCRLPVHSFISITSIAPLPATTWTSRDPTNTQRLSHDSIASHERSQVCHYCNKSVSA